jgi:hypothetical protein
VYKRGRFYKWKTQNGWKRKKDRRNIWENVVVTRKRDTEENTERNNKEMEVKLVYGVCSWLNR